MDAVARKPFDSAFLADVGENLYDLYLKVKTAAEKGVIANLVMNGQFPVSEINSDFINSYKEKARKWQLEERPINLEFNHGEFINKYNEEKKMSGTDFLAEELKRKADSNRACWSLIDMEKIIGSGDDPIPSFMVLQVALKDDVLYVSAYYRALEVSEFLPINLAEISIVIEKLQKKLGSRFNKFELTIFSFKCYFVQGFNCMEKALIDYEKSSIIDFSVFANNREDIRKWISNKLHIKESRIRIEGITALLEAVETYNDRNSGNTKLQFYSADFINCLKKALIHMNAYNDFRKATNLGEEAARETDAYRKELTKSLDFIAS